MADRGFILSGRLALARRGLERREVRCFPRAASPMPAPSGLSRRSASGWFRGHAFQGCAVDIIFQQFHEYKRQFRGAHNPYRIVTLKQADDVAKVFGVVSHHDGDTMQRRLNNIVSPARDKTPADKSDVRQRIQGCQLSNGIHQEDPAGDRLIFHRDRRQKRIFICAIKAATSLKRSGCLGAKIIAARGCLTRMFSNAFNKSGSSPSTVLPHTTTGPAFACFSDCRTLSTIGGGAGRVRSNFKFPVTLTRFGGAPIAIKRF